ncbi:MULTISPECIES: hypothetical protein [Pseudomonas]|uniref:hypothetical protein n=1 Tax=Pseudomonas TaxID=286 RepID=UPI00078D9937|nr:MULTISPECIES: hypothetical protein [Pseudomonas]AMT88384.1 hypothetical protein AYO71_12810 [Pseudomonas koreensis]AMT89835.1 hypothetical protein AYO71_20660 [Pseudomonas koreensis]TSB52410.1 hypothetical protein FEE99_09365 [Pseudomonas sp. ef1]
MSNHLKFVKVTHTTTVAIGDDRSFTVSRTENDGYQLEWCSRDASNGAAVTCTKIQVSEEAAMATTMGLSKILMEVDAEQAAAEQEGDE